MSPILSNVKFKKFTDHTEQEKDASSVEQQSFLGKSGDKNNNHFTIHTGTSIVRHCVKNNVHNRRLVNIKLSSNSVCAENDLGLHQTECEKTARSHQGQNECTFFNSGKKTTSKVEKIPNPIHFFLTNPHLQRFFIFFFFYMLTQDQE